MIDEELVRTPGDWVVMLTVYVWIWLSLMVTFYAVREQHRRAKQQKRDEAKKENEQDK